MKDAIQSHSTLIRCLVPRPSLIKVQKLQVDTALNIQHPNRRFFQQKKPARMNNMKASLRLSSGYAITSTTVLLCWLTNVAQIPEDLQLAEARHQLTAKVLRALLVWPTPVNTSVFQSISTKLVLKALAEVRRLLLLNTSLCRLPAPVHINLRIRTAR